MFRAAFPTASDIEEKKEVAWVKETYDLLGNNGSSKEPHITRLAGTWVSPDLALELGTAYSLGSIITAVVNAQPDPNANYRRSGKSGGGSTTSAGNTPKSVASPAPKTSSLPTPSPTSGLTQPNPSKRRKESSPGPALAPIPAPAITGPRRSTRTKSPPVSRSAAAPMPPLMASVIPSAKKTTSKAATTTAKATPASQRRTRQEAVATPGGSDETAVDEDASMEADPVVDVASSELRKEDIKEQKELIDGLKKQRQERESLTGTSSSSSDSDVKKRVRQEEEANMKFEFKEPEVGERAIATNRRLGRFQRLEPQQKSFAWGVAAFAVGMSAVCVDVYPSPPVSPLISLISSRAFLPNFF